MKKIILLAGLLICGFAQAQIISATADGEPLVDGQTITVNGISAEAADVHLLVTNLTEETIYVKLRMNSIQNNNNGSNVQFCFGGLCYFNVEVDDMVPNNVEQGAITAGGTNGEFDHFWNQDTGDVAGTPVSYNMSFVQVDEDGTVLGTLLTFNYVYQPTMGTNDVALESLGINVNNTVVKDVLTINASQKATVEFYSVSGQLVKSASVAEGYQSLDLSALSTAVYIAKFTNENNQSSSVRIVKK